MVVEASAIVLIVLIGLLATYYFVEKPLVKTLLFTMISVVSSYPLIREGNYIVLLLLSFLYVMVELWFKSEKFSKKISLYHLNSKRYYLYSGLCIFGLISILSVRFEESLTLFIQNFQINNNTFIILIFINILVMTFFVLRRGR